MRVQVQPINMKGQPLFAEERKRREVFVGMLKIAQSRDASLKRVLTLAQILDLTDGGETPVLELYDAAVLSYEEGIMRLRGFELHDGVQYGQTWELKVLPA
jgi:hypothetical protein